MEEIIKQIIQVCDDKKGEDIRAYHVTDTSPLTDYVVFVSASTHVHIKAIAESVLKLFRETLRADASPDFYIHPKVSGDADSGWVAIDMNSCILHVMQVDARKHYALDELYQERGIVYYH
jgi:ribosome-associated protein